jgi:hypothetical protein
MTNTLAYYEKPKPNVFSYEWVKKARVLVVGWSFRPRLMFSSEARFYSSGASWTRLKKGLPTINTLAYLATLLVKKKV